ncbi:MULTISPECIES: endolytic transglycosylase MltG [Helicobacter]|uniref:Endolytic murein transglycosylase n=1 Tax=Helicobacter ibis TaxID=2962633 RepID=A0ABT4VDK9_9HELI|nr:endolytic transglycosylase MltG [Helicobacter sp. WB40]MDA3966585.1 endolytic transglycosylase MltG [Helicobacter sp. WB40]MDA3968799.1 endolytic transglycosylase MltG [Helicobacter ibis]
MSIDDKRVKNINIFSNLTDVFFILLIALCFYLQTPMSSSKVVYIPQGGINEIITYLKKNNFDLTYIDKYLLRIFGYPQSGWLDIKKTRLSKGDFLYSLTSAKAALEDIKLIPGETLYFFIKDIAKQMNLNEEKLYIAYYKYAPYIDGVILADTYKIPKGISENHLMYYLVNNSLKEHRKWAIKFLGEYDEKQWFRYVTIASIIQKESANEEEMPLVSAVIHNRLKLKMKLQMDGTLNYGKYSHTKVTPKMIQNDTSPYNTYKKEGIPEAPVGSVSFKAILSAIFPANVDYLYFVRNKQGVHSFSKTYKEHINNFDK